MNLQWASIWAAVFAQTRCGTILLEASDKLIEACLRHRSISTVRQIHMDRFSVVTGVRRAFQAPEIIGKSSSHILSQVFSLLIEMEIDKVLGAVGERQTPELILPGGVCEKRIFLHAIIESDDFAERDICLRGLERVPIEAHRLLVEVPTRIWTIWLCSKGHGDFDVSFVWRIEFQAHGELRVLEACAGLWCMRGQDIP